VPLRLTTLAGRLAVCRLAPDAPLPAWASSDFVSITRTADELSVICAESEVPEEATAERGWRALKVEGPLPFEATGIMAGLTRPLAEAGIPLFAVSTYDTDYLLVKDTHLEAASDALEGAGHAVARC
jgi:hypothetical protein